MAATSVSAAKNRMARAVESILDPWPASKVPIWEFFGSECAYCGVKLVKGERLGHIDQRRPRPAITWATSCWRALRAMGMRSSTSDWREFLTQKVSDSSCVRSASSGSSDGRRSTRSPSWLRHPRLPRPTRSCRR